MRLQDEHVAPVVVNRQYIIIVLHNNPVMIPFEVYLHVD